MFQQILVPLDGSQRAEQALPFAARIARATGGSIILLTVVTPPINVGTSSMELAPVLSNVFERDIASAERYLEHITTSGILQGCETSRVVLPGTPAQTILTLATARSSDLIVLSSHGRTGLAKWVLGSVAQKVARMSPVPVLVVREEADWLNSPQPNTGRSVRVLVPLDGSSFAETAWAPAASLSRALSSPLAGRLHLVYILPLVIAEGKEPGTLVEGEDSPACAEAQAYLQRVTHHLQEQKETNDLAISSSVVVNLDTAAALIALAERGEGGETLEEKSDLIAMATHGWGALERFVMGSVTERVLTGTKLPLLIIHPEKAGTLDQSWQVGLTHRGGTLHAFQQPGSHQGGM